MTYPLWHGILPMQTVVRDADPSRFLVAGEGNYAIDRAGRRYLDARSSMWNVTLGYSCEPVKEAMRRQLDALPSGTVLRYEHVPEVAVRYAAALADVLPAGLAHLRFGNTGSQMTESAAMLSRFYRRMTGEPGRVEIIALHHGYHGTGALATAMTGEPVLHEYSAPLDAHVHHVPASRIEPVLDVVDRLGAERVTAVIVEPVLGSAISAAPIRYLDALIEQCRARDIQVIADEVTTGAGRTGTMTVSERLRAAPDMIVLGKGLSAGYFPLAALAVADPIYTALAAPTLRLGFPNGSTTDGHPIGMAAGLAVLDILTAEGFLERVRETGRFLTGLILESLAGVPSVKAVVGEGLMLNIELVDDAGQPWSLAEVDRLRIGCRDRGLLTSYAHGTLPLLPPLTLGRDGCVELVERLAGALRA